MERSYVTQPVDTPANSSFKWLVILALVAVLFVQYSNGGWPFTPNSNPAPVVPIDDQQAINDSPVKKGDAAWIVVVEETKGRPAARQVVLDDYEFWFKELTEKEVRFRLFDDDDPACESYKLRAKAASIDVPFVMIVDDSGSVKEIASFPDSVDQIRKLIQ